MIRFRPVLAASAVAVAALTASAAPAAAAQSVLVRVTMHMRSDYKFDINHSDNDPDCPSVTVGSSRVITDMTTVRPAIFKVTKSGGRYTFRKQGLGNQREVLGVDMTAKMTRTTEGSTRSCQGDFPFPANGCGTRSWPLIGELLGPGRKTDRFYLVQDLSTSGGFDRLQADDKWRSSGCGFDSTNSDAYITQTSDPETGRIKQSYFVHMIASRLFARSPRRFTSTGESTFSTGHSTDPGGVFTEIRTASVTVRKL